MTEKSERPNTTTTRVCLSGCLLKIGAVIVAVAMCIATVWPTTSKAGEPRDFGKVCSDQASHRVFVTESLKRVKEGADRERVLDTLVCIAIGDGSDPLIACGAVRAAFHLAKENPRIQEHLLRIITDERTRDATVWTACKLFAYVGDGDGRKALLEHAKGQWHRGRANHALQALAEIGDADLLKWVDKTASRLDEHDPLRSVCNRLRERIRIQQDTPGMIAYLESEREDIGRDWIVRQAMRHRASREDVRRAVVGYLRRSTQKSSSSLHLSLVRACDEYGIFTPQDVRDIDAIRTARQTRFSAEDEGRWPLWATLPDTKRSEFYGLKR